MLERGKMEWSVVELVDTESLVPQEYLLRKVDRAVNLRKIYEIVEPSVQQRQRTAQRSPGGAVQDRTAPAFGRDPDPLAAWDASGYRIYSGQSRRYSGR